MMTTDQTGQEDISDIVYVIANMAHYASWFNLPEAPIGYRWTININTGDENQPVLPPDSFLADGGILVGDRSVVILTADPIP